MSEFWSRHSTNAVRGQMAIWLDTNLQALTEMQNAKIQIALLQNARNGVGVPLKNIKTLKQPWTTVSNLAFADWQVNHDPATLTNKEAGRGISWPV